MPEKLCLQWDDFKDNVAAAFGKHRGDTDFADVTLVCQDGQEVEAHRVILAASSPFFEGILRRNKKQAHPLIFMRGVSLEELEPIVDFLYFGETNICQEDLESFLRIAGDLQIMGLVPIGSGESGKDKTSKISKPLSSKSNTDQQIKEESNQFKPPETSQADFDNECDKTLGGAEKVSRYFSEDLKQLLEKSNSMIEKTPRKMPNGKAMSICKVCGKEGENGNIKQHIEQNHLEGVSIPCHQCETTFRKIKSNLTHK